eukprot:m.225482 g.225482  ORF g.225482 m.225482 type:complete len:278 (+) comp15957_c4_seq10:185-1018(+)
MCIIQGKVERVAKTNIMVAPIQNGLQLTVYSNNVAMKDAAGAMLLPFPLVAEMSDEKQLEEPCQLVDLSEYKTLFSELNRACFPVMKSLSINRNASPNCSDSLAVVQIGSYKASIVPTIGDFERLRMDVFTIDPVVFEFLSQKYPNQYGFVVCQLDKERDYHPFGYITQKLPDGSMFIPTMHYHEHAKTKKKHNPSTHADWDHEIFSINHPLLGPRQQDSSSKAATKSNGMFSKTGTCKRNVLAMEKLPKEMEPVEIIYGYKVDTKYKENHDLVCEA